MLLLFVAFRLYPLLDGLRLSFTNARLGRAQYAFVGLANYEKLLEDSRFQVSLVNTAFYTVASTLPILAVPLVLAVLLDRGIPLRTVLRSAFFFPFTLSVVTVGPDVAMVAGPRRGAVQLLPEGRRRAGAGVARRPVDRDVGRSS